MKIDLHVHTSERSGCGRDSQEQMIAAARARGLDALCFTDHHTLAPRALLDDLNRRHAPFRVFGGIEISTAEKEDILVIGTGDPGLESTCWHYDGLYDFVRERNGFIALAHPFRYHDAINIDVDRRPPDAIEARSINIPSWNEPRIMEVVHRLGCHALYNSDAHSAPCVGTFHVDLQRVPAHEAELGAILKSGSFTRCTAAGELFELVDERGKPTGFATRERCHSNPALLHPVVHVLVLDSKGRVFLQKRAMNKDIQPGKWDTSVGGHMQPGENPEAAARREMLEELGVEPKSLRFSHEYVWRSDRESEFVRTYIAKSDGPFSLQADEIDEGRFWSRDEIRSSLNTGIFTPNFEMEFKKMEG